MGVVVAVGDAVEDGFLLVFGEGVELVVPVVLVFGEGVLWFPDGGVVEGGGVEGCCDAAQGGGHGCFSSFGCGVYGETTPTVPYVMMV